MNDHVSHQRSHEFASGLAIRQARDRAEEAQQRVAHLLLELLWHVDAPGRRLIDALASAEENSRAQQLSLYRMRLLDSLPHHLEAIDAARPPVRSALAALGNEEVPLRGSTRG